ncbi:MAG: hypothetical protein ABJM43_09430 [Paracoccaceae bacterium]
MKDALWCNALVEGLSRSLFAENKNRSKKSVQPARKRSRVSFVAKGGIPFPRENHVKLKESQQQI